MAAGQKGDLTLGGQLSYTASPGPSLINGGRQANVVDNGLEQAGHMITRAAEQYSSAVEQEEARDAVVKAQELRTKYMKALDDAYLNGTPLQDLQSKFSEEQSTLEGSYQTNAGYRAAREHGQVSEHYLNVRSFELGAKAFGDKMKTDILNFDTNATYFIQQNPLMFADRLRERDDVLATFYGHVPPGTIDLVRAEGRKQYLKNAVTAAIKMDPDRMQHLLEDTQHIRGGKPAQPKAPQVQETTGQQAQPMSPHATIDEQGNVQLNPFDAVKKTNDEGNIVLVEGPNGNLAVPEERTITKAEYGKKYSAQERGFADALVQNNGDEYDSYVVLAKQAVDAKKNDAAAQAKAAKEAQKTTDEKHLNDMLTTIGQGKMGEVSESAILTNPTISAEAKLKAVDVLRKYRNADDKAENQDQKAAWTAAGNSAYSRIFLPDSDPKHIDDPKEIDSMLTRGEIGPMQHRELRTAIANREKPINKRIGEVVASAKAVLIPHLPPGVTPMESDIQARAQGEKNLAAFRAQIDAQIKDAEKNNRDPSHLFDPNKPGNLYEQLRSFEIRSLQHGASRAAEAVKQSGQTAAPATVAKPQAPGAPSAKPKLPTINNQQDFDKLPKGAHYFGPDGKERIK